MNAKIMVRYQKYFFKKINCIAESELLDKIQHEYSVV